MENPEKVKILCGKLYRQLAEEYGFDMAPDDLWSGIRVGVPLEKDALFVLDLLTRDSRMRRAWVGSFDYDIPMPRTQTFADGLVIGWSAALIPVFIGAKAWILATLITAFAILYKLTARDWPRWLSMPRRDMIRRLRLKRGY